MMPVPESYLTLAASITPRPNTNDTAIIADVIRRDTYRTLDDPPRGVVVDIGANIGAFTLLAALTADVVHAYEPDPEATIRLAINTGQPLRYPPTPIRIWSSPVWSHRAMLGRIPDPDNTGGTRYRPGVDAAETAVAVTLADVVDEAGGHIDYLKLDCEGAEYAILHRDADGAVDALEHIDRIVMEYHGPRMAHMESIDPVLDTGALLSLLAETGKVTIFGRPSTGGRIWWRRHGT